MTVGVSSNQPAGQTPVVTSNNVPKADSHDLEDRPFVAVVRKAKAVAQITGSFSLPWPSTVQRKPTAVNGRFLALQSCDFEVTSSRRSEFAARTPDSVVDDNYLGRIDSAVLLPVLTRCLT